MISFLRGLMSGDGNTNRPFPALVLLGIVDFCCILIGLEQISVGKLSGGAVWIGVGVGSGLVGYYWEKIKAQAKRVVGTPLYRRRAYSLTAIALVAIVGFVAYRHYHRKPDVTPVSQQQATPPPPPIPASTTSNSSSAPLPPPKKHILPAVSTPQSVSGQDVVSQDCVELRISRPERVQIINQLATEYTNTHPNAKISDKCYPRAVVDWINEQLPKRGNGFGILIIEGNPNAGQASAFRVGEGSTMHTDNVQIRGFSKVLATDKDAKVDLNNTTVDAVSPFQTPRQIINAPNGIAIGGGVVNNPTVNNVPPPPRITVTTTELAEAQGKAPYGLMVTFSTDQRLEVAAFAMQFDVPYRGQPEMTFSYTLSNSENTVGTSESWENPSNHFAFTMAQPMSLEPGQEIHVTVRSDKPIHLVGWQRQ